MKMDLQVQDAMACMLTKRDPHRLIRQFYANMLNRIPKLLEPHLCEVKDAADTYIRGGLHDGRRPVQTIDIQGAESISELLNLMSVKESWDNTDFLRQAVDAIPAMARERDAAEGILSHYIHHLLIYEEATPLVAALANRKEYNGEDKGSVVVSQVDNRLIPLDITSSISISDFTLKDCHSLQKWLLGTVHGIPKNQVFCRDAKERRSTTVTFIIPDQYITTIMQNSSQLLSLWVLLEHHVIEVAIPGVFFFSPTVECFLDLLRESKTFSADIDFLGMTEVRDCTMRSCLNLSWNLLILRTS